MDIHKEHSHKSHKPVKNRYRVPPVLLSRMTMKMDRHALRKLLRRFYFVSLAGAFLLGGGAAWAETAAAQSGSSATKMVSKEGSKKIILPTMEPAEKKAKGEVKKVRGTVSGIGPYGVAVEYGGDPERGGLEMWMDFMKETKFAGSKKFSDFQYGDTVEATYKELEDTHKKLLQEIKLVKRKPPEPIEKKSE